MPRSEHHVIYYDGECAFCLAQVRWLRKLDWLRRFKFIPIQDPRTADQLPEIAPEALEKYLHLRSLHGKVLRGAAAVRFIFLRLPLLSLLGLLLYLPGAIYFANRAYNWVSTHRHDLMNR